MHFWGFNVKEMIPVAIAKESIVVCACMCVCMCTCVCGGRIRGGGFPMDRQQMAITVCRSVFKQLFILWFRKWIRRQQTCVLLVYRNDLLLMAQWKVTLRFAFYFAWIENPSKSLTSVLKMGSFSNNSTSILILSSTLKTPGAVSCLCKCG